MKQKHIVIVISIFLIAALPSQLLAYEGDDESDTIRNSTELRSQSPQYASTSAENKEMDKTSVFSPLSDFPNLHPLVVHFPIMLLILAVFSQLAGFFVFRYQLSWITLFLLFGGFIGGILAANVFHAHASGVTEHVREIFETHERLANWTIWLTGIALVFKVISHFLLKRKVWMEILVFLAILSSGIAVSLTGHLGAEMVYLYNVGPENKFVEQHDE